MIRPVSKFVMVEIAVCFVAFSFGSVVTVCDKVTVLIDIGVAEIDIILIKIEFSI